MTSDRGSGSAHGEAPAPRVKARMIEGDEDFWRVHRLLVDLHPVTGPGHIWNTRRWEGWRFYRKDPSWDRSWCEQVRLWETAEGQVVAVAHPEGKGWAHLQVHPAYQHLEDEMLAWAEQHLAKPDTSSGSPSSPTEGPGQAPQSLQVFAFEYDARRTALLETRGYDKLESGGVARLLRFLGQPLGVPVVADGYVVRATRPDELDDRRRIADVLNAGFGRDIHNAEEYGTFTNMAPSFRRDLDLVAVAPDGAFAAYVGVPYDETNRFGLFEPVCTHPDHRRKGLARALMLEGLRRLSAIGAAEAMVESGDPIAANRLYDGIGFSEAHKGHNWRKMV